MRPTRTPTISSLFRATNHNDGSNQGIWTLSCFHFSKAIGAAPQCQCHVPEVPGGLEAGVAQEIVSGGIPPRHNVMEVERRGSQQLGAGVLFGCPDQEEAQPPAAVVRVDPSHCLPRYARDLLDDVRIRRRPALLVSRHPRVRPEVYGVHVPLLLEPLPIEEVGMAHLFDIAGHQDLGDGFEVGARWSLGSVSGRCFERAHRLEYEGASRRGRVTTAAITSAPPATWIADRLWASHTHATSAATTGSSVRAIEARSARTRSMPQT